MSEPSQCSISRLREYSSASPAWQCSKAVHAGSRTAAANALGMSSQRVAEHVVVLEDQHGGRLPERPTRRQSLIEFGQACTLPKAAATFYACP